MTTMKIAPIGATIPATEIRPGYVIDLDGESYPVERVEAAGPFVSVNKFPEGSQRAWRVLQAGELIRVLGYFNPESV